VTVYRYLDVSKLLKGDRFTLQQFTDRPNNDRRSRELRTFVYDVADL
jgi:hypothetical protein